MSNIEIHKFGGTSVGSVARIAAAAKLMSVPGPKVVVSSAMAGVTDLLVRVANVAEGSEPERAIERLEAIRESHHAVARELVDEPAALLAALDSRMDQAAALVQAAIVLGELSPRGRDRLISVGEKLAVQLLAAAMRAQGVAAVATEADGFLDTDGRFGMAKPITGVADRHIVAALLPRIERGEVPVVTGFCGRAPDGATTTLGRGGSDLSATLIAAALGARQVTIWTDVRGVYTADPRAVPEARVIPHLNYREAAEMSFYGAKVLHPRTMMPVAEAGIPVVTRSSFEAEAPGTLVDATFTPGSHPVKAITAVQKQALISVEGNGMAGIPGVAARLFSALGEVDISVTMISQSSSEASITLAVEERDAEEAERSIKRAFRGALTRGEIEDVSVRRQVALVAAVGLGMARTPGVAARAFGAVGTAGVNILAIAQGSSELNLTLAVDQAQVGQAIRAMHAAFGLDRRDTGDDTLGRLDLMLLGCGKIAKALVSRLFEDVAAFERMGVAPRLVAVADSSGFVLEPKGFARDQLAAMFDHKAGGQRLVDWPGGEAGDAHAMVRAACAWRLSRPVLVDVSDADGAEQAFVTALTRGADVVTANKRPLAGPTELFEQLGRAARRNGRLVRAEATVGAGLPIVDTLELLVQTGDVVREIQGSLSGTLGYVMSEVERGLPMSKAVRQAADVGFTEPDPVQDLCGADVGRKALILARWAGVEIGEVELEGLVPKDWSGMTLDALEQRLVAEVDERIAAQLAAARDRGCTLRYLARVSPASTEVGLAEVPLDSPWEGSRARTTWCCFELNATIPILSWSWALVQASM